MRRLGWGVFLVTLVAGCQQSDTETLTRIGRKLADRGQAALGDVRSRIDLNWKPGEASLEERIKLRLKYDKEVGEVAIDLKVEGAEVEVGGKVSHGEHKRRIVELIWGTLGVEKVTDTLVVETPMPDPPREEGKIKGDKKEE